MNDIWASDKLLLVASVMILGLELKVVRIVISRCSFDIFSEVFKFMLNLIRSGWVEYRITKLNMSLSGLKLLTTIFSISSYDNSGCMIENTLKELFGVSTT